MDKIIEIIAFAVGIVAVALYLLSYQQKTRGKIIAFNLTSRILYILQYILLGAFAGAVLDVLGAVSSVLAKKKDSKFIKKHFWLVFIAMDLAIVVAGVVTMVLTNDYFGIFSIIGVLLHTSAFWMNDEKKIRLVSFAGSPFWFVYNFASQAYGSSVGDLLSMVSIVIAMIKYRNIKTQDSEKETAQENINV